MLNPVLIPPQSVVDSWNKLSDMPIVETVPRSVPLSCFLRFPNEDNYNRIITSKTTLPASKHESSIQILYQSVLRVDHYLSLVYPMRSISAPLVEYKKSLSPEENAVFKEQAARDIAKTYLDNLFKLLTDEMRSTEEIVATLKAIWTENSIWEKGNYSSTMLDIICLIIYKMTAFEQLAPSKASITADISQFSLIYNDKSQISSESLEARRWIASVHAHTMKLITSVEQLDFEQTIRLFDIFTNYLREKIEANDYTYGEMHYAHVVAYSFFINFYQQQSINEQKNYTGKKKNPKWNLKPLKVEVVEFVEKLIECFPNLPLVFEFNIEFKALLYVGIPTKDKKDSSKNPPKIERPKFEQYLPTMKKNYESLISCIEKSKSGYVSSVECGKAFTNLLPKIFHDISSSMNSIREQILATLTNPPPKENEEDQTSSFERSMRKGIKNNQLRDIMLVLAICHNTKEQIEENLPLIYENCCQIIEANVQDFVRTKLAAAIIRSEEKELLEILNNLRAIFGYFKTDDELKVSETSVKKLATLEDCGLKSAPNPGMLELLRVQLEFLTNPESKFMNKPKLMAAVPLSDTDQKEILSFLSLSKHYLEIVQLQDTLDLICDQSNFYFKEFYLSQTVGNFFPVKCSLPFILTDFALSHYQKSELTDAIFFPLSIYDDAAAKALHFFKSLYMYDEIKEEARICIQSITQLISDKSFHPLRKFASYQSFPASILSEVSGSNGEDCLADNSSALRLRITLQQNQLYVLGCMIDTKGLIADRMNVLMKESIDEILKLTAHHGILASISVSKLLQILEKEHNLLLGTGLPLLPFDDILALSACSDSPNSLQSLLLFNYTSHLTEKVVNDYYLYINPMRLIPKKIIKVNIDNLHVGVEFREQMQAILSPTYTMITLESFREAFKQLGDGSSTILQHQVVGILDSLIYPLKNIYSEVKNRLTRITDSNINTSCKEVFERFEGAYRNFIDDQDIRELFGVMAKIGNLLAICELMDNAFLLQNQSKQQIISFLTSKTPTENNESDLFTCFDKTYQASKSWFSNLEKMPQKEEIVPPFLSIVLQQFRDFVLSENALFDENSNTILDQTSLTGFAAMWSILEFIFVLIESTKPPKTQGSFQLYGSGVLLCAAAILTVTNQQDLARVLSIGNRFSSHQLLDFAFNTDQKIDRFLNVHTLVSSIVECGITTYLPSVDE